MHINTCHSVLKDNHILLPFFNFVKELSKLSYTCILVIIKKNSSLSCYKHCDNKIIIVDIFFYFSSDKSNETLIYLFVFVLLINFVTFRFSEFSWSNCQCYVFVFQITLYFRYNQ